MIEEKFVRVVEQTANAAIATGRHTETVIHDMIKVLYGRKDINKLLPSGWIIANDCSECAYKDDPGDSDACYQCYNKLFNKNIIRLDPGPYTNNFKSKEKGEQKSTSDDLQRDCVDCRFDSLNIDDHPCRSCYYNDERPCFRPIEQLPTLDEREEKYPEEQKHVEVDKRYCLDCKYEELKVQEQPCYSCYWKADRPNFTPKEE